MSLPLFSYPTTVAWVDDDANFIATVPHLLNSRQVKTFVEPESCIEFFKNYQPFLQGVNFIRGCEEADNYESLNHLPVDLNSSAFQELPMQSCRYNEISVLVIDYDMPGMNGLDLCRELKEQPIKKILLTGVAGHQEAVDAFNEGLIDCYIQKDNPNVINETLFQIERLSKEYLVAQSQVLKSHLETDQAMNISDPVFIKFFKTWCKENKIKEYFLADKLGTILMINENGDQYYFVTHTDRTLNSFTELYDDEEKNNEYVQLVSARKKIPYFGVGVDGWQVSQDKWESCFYSPSLLNGRQAYYWAIVS